MGRLAVLGPWQVLVGKISVFGVLSAEFDGGFVSGKRTIKLDNISISFSQFLIRSQLLENGLP